MKKYFVFNADNKLAQTYQSSVPPSFGGEFTVIEVDPEQYPEGSYTATLIDGKIVTAIITPRPYDLPSYMLWDELTATAVPDPTLQATAVKNKRNSLLQGSDWTQLSDVPVANKQAWSTYRQALRDITSQPGYPLEVVWPTAPE